MTVDDGGAAAWAAPEAPAPGGAATAANRGTARTPGAAAPVLEVPVPLRPMTVADILDGSFAVLKAAPAKVLGIVAIFVVPVQVLAAYLQRDLLGGSGFADLLSEDTSVLNASAQQQTATATWGPLILAVVQAITLPFVCGALIKLISGWYAGRDPSASELLRAVGRRWWALLASWFLVHLLEAFSLVLCVLPVLAVMTWFVVTAPVAVAESLGPIRAMRRSVELTRRRFGPCLGVALLTGVVANLLDQALGLLPDTVALIVGLDVGWPLLALGGTLSRMITTPLIGAAAALLYLDLRVRTEGLDLELDAIDLFDRDAPA